MNDELQEAKWREIFRENSSREWDEESGPYRAMSEESFIRVITPLINKTGFTTGFYKKKCNNCGHDNSRDE